MTSSMTKMKIRATSVAKHAFQQTDRLFLDANIWLYFYCPQNPNDSHVKIYSSAFRRILAARCKIFVDVLVVSEFVNRYARIKWKTEAPGLRNFKTFRDSYHFPPIAKEISDNVRRIVKHCSRVDSEFANLAIQNLLDEFAMGAADFNDQVIAILCRNKKATLVTHDGDFTDGEIPILTANPKLLSAP